MKKLGSFVPIGAFGGFAAGLVSLVLPSLSGCKCSAVGCGSVATLSVEVAANVSLPEGTTVTVCFNDTCVVGTLPAPTDVPPHSFVGITFPQRSDVWGTEWPADVTGHGRVEIQWSLYSETRLEKGDRYSVTLNDPAGVQLATNEATVASYFYYEPDGPYCDSGCYLARFR